MGNDNSNKVNIRSMLHISVWCYAGTSMYNSQRLMMMNMVHTGQLWGQRVMIQDDNNGAPAARKSGKTMTAPWRHGTIWTRLHSLLAKYKGRNDK